MTRALRYLLPLCLSLPVWAATQMTFTGVVQAPSGALATSGYIEFDLTPQNQSIAYSVSGAGLLAPQIGRCGINSSGQIKNSSLTGACTVWGNDVILPGNSLYKIIVAPGNRIINTINNVLLTGTTADISNLTLIAPTPVVGQTLPFSPLVSMSIIPGTDSAFTLGQPNKRYAAIYGNGYFGNDIATPQPPASGEVGYFKAGSGWCSLDSTNTERCVGSTTNITNCLTAGAIAVYAVTGQVISCSAGITVTAGTENSQSWGDNSSVSNAPPGQMKLASLNGAPSIGFNGPVSPIITAAVVSQPNGVAGLNASAVLPIAEVVTSLTNCDVSHVIKGDQTCGNALTISTNGTNNSSQSAINFQDATAFNGLTLTWTNPGGGGNEKPVVGGSLDLATQNHPSITINGTTCTLGSSCTPSSSSGSTLLNSQGPQASVQGTGALANIYTFSIPGNTMSTTSCIRAVAFFHHSTGSVSTPYTWSYGGTTLTTAGNAGSGQASWTFFICNNGATNSQFLSAAAMTLGASVIAAQIGTSAADTTTAQSVSLQFNVASTDRVTPDSFTVESLH